MAPSTQRGDAGAEPDGVVVIDGAGIVRSWSEGAIRLFGYDASEAVGRELAELVVPPSLQEGHREGIRRFVEAAPWPPPTRTLTFPASGRDRPLRPVVATLLPVEVDGGRWCVGVVRSADGQRSASSIPGSELLQTIFERAPEIITIIDPSGGQRTVNEAGSLLMGYGPEGHSSAGSDLIHPDDRGRVADRFTRMLSGNLPEGEPIRFRVLAGDGRWVWLEMLTADLTDIADVGGFVAFSRDVSEDEQRRADLEAAGEQLRQLAASRLAFATAVSHELRTPLAAISSAVESLLAEQRAGSVDLASYLALIGRNAGRLSRVIDDLLFLSRNDAGTADLVHEPLDLLGVVEELVVDLQIESARRALRIELDGQDGPLMRGDTQRIGQAIENVIRNAMKFADEGSVVSITCSPRAGCWEVTVANDGPSVSPLDAERVFEPFVRLDRTKRTAGSGLGLTVARDIVEAHGGTIRFDTTRATGARVVLEFPVEGTSVSTAASVAPRVQASTILANASDMRHDAHNTDEG